ncbi:hypothetical protein [Actinoplanes sp. NPDC049118]|uniref:hypothetical protein n=1 Tax=Actinoplanes sp. NPDC049118 TaxID=3155769 RepID=UPI0033CF27F5
MTDENDRKPRRLDTFGVIGLILILAWLVFLGYVAATSPDVPMCGTGQDLHPCP